MKIKDNLVKILVPVLAILVAFAAGGIIMLCMGKIPFRHTAFCFPARSEAQGRSLRPL